MQVYFTRHALARMQERQVSEDEVLATLAAPIHTEVARGGSIEARGWLSRGGKRMLLRVIYRDGAVISVITVIASSKLAKYGANDEV